MENENSYFGWLQKSFFVIIGAIVSFGVLLQTVIDNLHDQLYLEYENAYKVFCGMYFLLILFAFIFWLIFYSKGISSIYASDEKPDEKGIKKLVQHTRTNYHFILGIVLMVFILLSIFMLAFFNLKPLTGVYLFLLPLIVIGIYALLLRETIQQEWLRFKQSKGNRRKWVNSVPRSPLGNIILILLLSTLIMLLLGKYSISNIEKTDYEKRGYLFVGDKFTFSIYEFEKQKLYHRDMDKLLSHISAIQNEVNCDRQVFTSHDTSKKSVNNVCSLDTTTKKNVQLLVGKIEDNIDHVYDQIMLFSKVDKINLLDSTLKLDSAYLRLADIYEPDSIRKYTHDINTLIQPCTDPEQLADIKKSVASIQAFNDITAGWTTEITRRLFSGLVRTSQNEGLIIFIAGVLFLMQLWLFIYLKVFAQKKEVKEFAETMTAEELKDTKGVKYIKKEKQEQYIKRLTNDLGITETFIYILVLLTIPFFKSVPPDKINLDNPVAAIVSTAPRSPIVPPAAQTENNGDTGKHITINYNSYSTDTSGNAQKTAELDATTKKQIDEILKQLKAQSTGAQDKERYQKLMDKISGIGVH